MLRTFWICLLLLLANWTFGQDWRPLYSGRTAYYRAYWEFDIAIRWTLDGSRVAGLDSIWYPELLHPVDHPVWDSCYGFTPGPPPLGDSIRVFANGDMDFYFPDGDTLHWKADLSQPWVMLRNPSGSNPRLITATPAGYTLGTVLGQPDSILNLDLALTDSMGVTTYAVSQLSQHHGWLDPVLRISSYEGIFEYQTKGQNDPVSGLRGITQPNLGVQNLPKEAFFTMQAGDTIQILERYSEDLYNEDTYLYQQDIYLARNTSPIGDTIFFTIDRAKFGTSNLQVLPPPSRSVVIDTIPLNTPAYQRLDRDLGEMYAPDFRASAWIPEWRTHRQFGRLMKPMSLLDTVRTIDTCYKIRGRGYAGNEFWHSWLLDTYMEGLGGPYWGKWFFLFDLIIIRDVTYFHTTSGQGGTYLNFDSLMHVTPPRPESLLAFTLSPNPNAGDFQVQLSEALALQPLQLQLLAVDGRVVQVLRTQGEAVVDVRTDGLAPGMYLLRVAADGYAQARRVIIR